MTSPRDDGATASAIMRDFIGAHEAVFGFNEADLNTLVATRQVDSDPSSQLSAANLPTVRHVSLEQRWQGRQIFPTNVVGSVTDRGQMVGISGLTVQNVGAKVNALDPVLGAPEAVAAAAASLGATSDSDTLEVLEMTGGAEMRQTVTGSDAFAGEVPVRLIYFLTSGDDIRLVWEVVGGLAEDRYAYQILVDAVTGDILYRETITSNDVPRYLSYFEVRNTPTVDARSDFQPLDSPGPLTPGPATPDGSQGAIVPPVIVSTNGDPAVSTSNWTADGVMTTAGNNVVAFVDLNFNNNADAGEQPTASLVDISGVQTREFNFPADLTAAPQAQANRDAATVNTFVVANWWHDRMADLGFTEQAGNFQSVNSTGTGVAGDPIRARLQVGTDNSTFGTPPADGTCCPTLNSFTWTGPDPDRDSGFDTEILIHEFTHGLSNRIIGGPNTNGLAGGGQPGGLGEGYSDLYALHLLRSPDEDPDATYVVGGYAVFHLNPAFGNPPNWDDNYYFGIRHFPYSTDLCANPFTLLDMQTPTYDITPIPSAGCAATPPVSPWLETRSGAVHDMGEIWAVTVWEARRNLVSKHGADLGNELMLQLMTDSMFLLAAGPTFVEARDAIIASDLARTGGANRCELWRGFAKRGMGVGAATPSSGSFTEDFAFPENCNTPPPAAYAYAAKLVCGIQEDPEDFRLTQGRYATTVNIRNPGPEVARFTKTLALTYPPIEQEPGEVKLFAEHSLRPELALASDCDDIREKVFGNNWPTPYIEGFLVIKSDHPLDVVGVYTKSALEAEAGGVAIDVERVPASGHSNDDTPPPPGKRADLLPVPDANGNFCRIRGRDLLVTVRNEGPGTAGASTTMVDFGSHGQAALPTPSLANGASANLSTPIPQGCFDPDCGFRIKADNAEIVIETDEANNSVAGSCIG
ncbi:M36 family metallopeptidase [Roseovarius sp. Pro17]|uniref:M36 family metallopeptidase n=1 Tax=Roseovarius sp. Pro17 TaxID=3108175 RepID=UPI002D788369|nr:M36 family metallopeptidase [Roseovarius sp. Pro17]